MRRHFTKIGKIAIGISIAASLAWSCKKDEADPKVSSPVDSDPEYYGTWVYIQQLTNGVKTVDIKEIYTFKADTFSKIRQVKDADTRKWIDFEGSKGVFSVNDSLFDITIKEVGYSSINPVTNMPTGTMIYYKSSDNGFKSYVEQYGVDVNLKCIYEVLENELTLRTDLNNDMDFADPGETVTYLRQVN